MTLTGNDLSENQFILREIFLTEYNDELALNPINKYSSAFYVTSTRNLVKKRKNSWLRVAHGLVEEMRNNNTECAV